jgi:RNA-directed DNA polymerase
VEKRPLGIPTVVDRVVQAAVRMAIEPIFENRFAKHSYGFRPGCGCKEALRRVDALLEAGHTHVVDVDIKGYFDAIPHQRLMALVREHIADGKVLGLIEGFLKQGVIEGANWQEAKDGTPQGGVISPLLANIYLNPLDWLMAGLGFEMVRYADDMVVLCRNQEEAEAALEKLREWMTEAGLTLHPEKTRTVDMNKAESHFDFLGYRFKRSRRGSLMRLVRPKSMSKLRESIKPRTRRNDGKSMEAIVADINQTLVGWYGYFKHAKDNELGGIDGWIRMRLRSILRKRRGCKGRGRGRPPTLAQPLLHRTGALLPAGGQSHGNHQSPIWSKPLTGEPDAGDPPVRFGGGSGTNQCLVPTSIKGHEASCRAVFLWEGQRLA